MPTDGFTGVVGKGGQKVGGARRDGKVFSGTCHPVIVSSGGPVTGGGWWRWGP